jgi:wyosine [tRNA(Phe)-imidazoG37] synthetase (radical SAM superfamily)
MATFLFDKIIFGPIKSRRLGISLGINLLPLDKKVCNFNCVYCECGWTEKSDTKFTLPSAITVNEELASKLQQMQQNKEELDVITFAGNGEPTMHPQFGMIIDNTIALRNKFFPTAKIAVLSNATLIRKKSVFNALQKVDQNILKLDSGIEATCKVINKPTQNFHLIPLIEYLKKMNGNLIIQTLFLKGCYNDTSIDNTTETEVNTWLSIIEEIRPKQVMIYSLARDTPASNLEKVSKNVLTKIANKVKAAGIEVQVTF